MRTRQIEKGHKLTFWTLGSRVNWGLGLTKNETRVKSEQREHRMTGSLN